MLLASLSHTSQVKTVCKPGDAASRGSERQRLASHFTWTRHTAGPRLRQHQPPGHSRQEVGSHASDHSWTAPGHPTPQGRKTGSQRQKQAPPCTLRPTGPGDGSLSQTPRVHFPNSLQQIHPNYGKETNGPNTAQLSEIPKLQATARPQTHF